MNVQKKTTKWWSRFASSCGVSRRVDGPTDAGGNVEWQYWWLLPGDASYASPATNDPKAE